MLLWLILLDMTTEDGTEGARRRLEGGCRIKKSDEKKGLCVGLLWQPLLDEDEEDGSTEIAGNVEVRPENSNSRTRKSGDGWDFSSALRV